MHIFVEEDKKKNYVKLLILTTYAAKVIRIIIHQSIFHVLSQFISINVSILLTMGSCFPFTLYA